MSFLSKLCAVSLLACGIIVPPSLTAQSPQASATNRVPALTEKQSAGKGLFLQNCALCHLPNKPVGSKSAENGTSVGPSLKGLFRGDKPASEPVVRTFILKGVANKMPGFQYALKPEEIENVVAYLKTL